MEYTAILNQIKKGHLRPVYLLHGEEAYLISQLERAVAETALPPDEREAGLVVLENDPNPDFIAELIETAPFFGAKNVIVIRDSSLLKAKRGAEEGEAEEKKDKGVLSRLLDLINRMPDFSVVVFSVSGKADKRKKLYKAIEQAGAVVELSSPKAKDARIWITDKLTQLDKKMAADAMDYYLGVLSMMPKISVAMIHNELEKISLFAGSRSTITRRDLDEIMASVPEVNVFEMTEALSRKDIRTALGLLQSQLSCGEHPIKILGLLAFHVRRLWQIKDMADAGKDARDAAEALKIHSFIAERLFRQSKSFSSEQLKHTMLELANADKALKSGRANGSVLEKIMIELCM